MKWFIIGASTILALSSFSSGSYASCRDNTGPKGSLITCVGGGQYHPGGPDIRLRTLAN
ncbi:MAG: hypothetical protein NTZ54_13100 [Alphaproteobacteria bacterium]|nr:hypothetical protein [Alphaproteobacteria bacterium]